MNGVHDMGGQHGFGPVEPEADEPVFHADWERTRVRADARDGRDGRRGTSTRRASPASARHPRGTWRAPTTRSGSRRSSCQLAEHGLVGADEVEAGRSLRDPAPIERTLLADDVLPTLGRGGPTARDAARPARFAVGERVRARNLNPPTHIRLPRYVRGHVGTVELVHAPHVFPDTHAHGLGEEPEWLYTVRFDARELWGPDADPTVRVSTDAFEPYLEPVA